MKLTVATILTVAVALSTPLIAQIPKQARWEITFAQVEAAAGLPDLSTAGSDTYEARVMQRPWSATAPMPFLRLIQTAAATRAQMFLFWNPNNMAPQQRPTGSDVFCRDGICVRPIGITEQHEWGEILEALKDACPEITLGFCADCEDVWIKTKTNNIYREQSCNAPKPETPARTVLQLMMGAALASR